MYAYLVSLPRSAKTAILVFIDICLICTAYYGAIVLRKNALWHAEAMRDSLDLLAFLIVAGMVLSYFLGLYSIKLAHYDQRGQIRFAVWVVLLGALGGLANYVFGFDAPTTVPLLFGALMLPLCVGVRFAALAVLHWLRDRGTVKTPVAIYGAGEAGMLMFAALKSSDEFRPVMIVDDNPAMQRLMVGGLKIRPYEALAKAAASERVGQVFLAIPSIGQEKTRELSNKLLALGLKVKVLPSFTDILSAGSVIKSLNDVAAADLLGRDKIELDMPEIAKTYKGRSVLISGAGGSIGSELSRQVIAARARKVVLFDLSEFALYKIEQELRPMADAHGVKLVPVLGSVTDPIRARAVLRAEEIDIVLHAAAYKHVPLIEENEVAGVRNNVIGTQVMAEAARAAGVRRFLFVSTDKAVRPTNIMGATKRLAELVVQDMQTRSENTIFSMVRFGNVLGSSGSVIPLFQDQIKSGGPVTLTHADVTRYFMTIPEAARLVLLAGSYAEGGEVFVLDMGKPVRILDLARRMVEMSGLTVRDKKNPSGDIELKFTGLRPGEKLYEELLIDARTLPTPHPKILRAKEDKLSEIEVARMLRDIATAVEKNDAVAVRQVVSEWVDGYHTQHIAASEGAPSQIL
jgi:FlaA1/EpsC-like NDP-sugar epimerase